MNTSGLYCTTSISGTQYYREWKNSSGTRVWLEQGGYFDKGKVTTQTITLLKAFSNANYVVITQSTQNTANNTDNNANKVIARTTTNFNVLNYEEAGVVLWYACGK